MTNDLPADQPARVARPADQPARVARPADQPARRGARAARGPVATDVARAAGVSQKTVSRVVNDDPHVRPEVRARVLAAIESLGYHPNRAARNLVLGRTRSIGLLSVGSTDYGPSALMVATEEAVRAAGYALLVVNTLQTEVEDISGPLRDLVEQGVDGVVVIEPVGSFELAPGLLGDLPMMSLSGEYGISTTEIVVDTDQADGARQAVDHLLGLGHRTVHHVSGPAGWRSSGLRRDGWRRALERAGRVVPEPLVGDWSARSGYEAGARLAADPDVTAVLCANDQTAIGLVRAFREAGRNVPRDVSVIGFDDVPEAAYLSPALTTVRQDLQGMARHGVGLLLAAVDAPRPGSHVERLPLELVLRETTAPPTTAPPTPAPPARPTPAPPTTPDPPRPTRRSQES